MFKTLNLLKISKELVKKAEKYERKSTLDFPLNKTLFVFGDSTAVGVGASKNTLSTAGLLGEKYTEAEVLNFGVSGAKLEDVIYKQFPQVERDKKADIIIVQAGANDIVQFTNLKDVENSLKKVLNLAKEKIKPDGKIIILHSGNVGSSPIFPFPFSYILKRRTRLVRNIYLKNVSPYYVDLFQEKNEDIFLSDPKKFFAPDSFHPGDAGYKYWFDKIEEKLL